MIIRLSSNLQPSMLGSGPEKELLESIGAEMGFFPRVMFSNIWLFKPILQ
jgi:hypothetical protein